MNRDILEFNRNLPAGRREICDLLSTEIQSFFKDLPDAENKLWHGAPVWFLNGNPIVGYDSLKNCVRLLFWSGQSFNEPSLQPEGSFKAAEVRYENLDKIKVDELAAWLKKAKDIQWDYKNIVKRRGVLERLS
ncbi:MAG TPA: DUF1801 domain-containing protein [Candidatus Saccharimonadales bacterium]|nr:DUF1801 domain-containing protein [Candidatus Saccharimonadales bacterium]